MATEKSPSKRLKAICDELWSVKTELDALAYLVRSMNEAENGSALLGLGLILEGHAKILDDLIAAAYREKP